jgi:nucleotide-binding universal stress UspA family protein
MGGGRWPHIAASDRLTIKAAAMPNGPHHILCATDFSRFSAPVIDYAAGLAARIDARLIVFHALSFPRNPLYGTVESRPVSDDNPQLQSAAHRIEALMRHRSLRWEALVRYGDPVDEILKLADERSLKLVIAASQRLSGWKRMLMGTIIEQLARCLPLPLLVVHPRKPSELPSRPPEVALKRILVCCDPSPETAVLVPVAQQLAEPFGSELHFVQALEAPLDVELVDPTAAPYGEVQQILQQQLLRRLTERIPDDLRRQPRCTVKVIPGTAGEVLPAYAADHRVDLMVVGVRRHSKLEKFLIGSTTEAILRRAPCEVLTVPGAAAVDPPGAAIQ